ncbi:MAG: DUF1573 domain-containing protein [Phycisphaeraceae bacterium]|nr:DUF1573 domain-containing protein [Phycisphaerales bacterium]MCB9843860.1 DUF1573 domain-containing protein [Phycisphaeraceae bacterium]
MRKTTFLVLAIAAASLGACDRKKDAAPAGGDAPPAIEEPAGETSEQITKRLLEASFMQPSGIEVVSGMPPISLDPDLVDLGDMMPNTKKSGSLVMKNVGDKPLRILALRSTCACTVPGIQSDTIQPGESITIELELDANSATGATLRYIMALIEGYTQPVQLIVQADVNYGVRTSVTYDPPDQARTADIELRSTDESVPFTVISAGGMAPKFLDGFDPVKDEPRTHYTIRQDFSMYSAEQLPRWFIIETDHPTAAVIDVPVPNYELNPERLRHRFNLSESRLVLGRMEAGESVQRTVRVLGGDLPPAEEFTFLVTHALEDLCGVSVSSSDNEEDGTLSLVIEVTPKPETRGVLFDRVSISWGGDTREIDIIGRVVAPE